MTKVAILDNKGSKKGDFNSWDLVLMSLKLNSPAVLLQEVTGLKGRLNHCSKYTGTETTCHLKIVL